MSSRLVELVRPTPWHLAIERNSSDAPTSLSQESRLDTIERPKELRGLGLSCCG